ncbi:hypothetical protein C7999DRAFT_30492 [Corynascus novoguineensis]|uniref:Uncharacterized protein n=1 Tax=Corynascus novoguineensis TaxID=1126955 RepID=A0AAN7HRJ8_9PEZI|nr:hypothetical protein C7999DRAFT_30492 [Corynascus novoguineensis]
MEPDRSEPVYMDGRDQADTGRIGPATQASTTATKRPRESFSPLASNSTPHFIPQDKYGVRLRSIAIVLDLPSGHNEFLGLLPKWSLRERHDETENLVLESIDTDAMIEELWKATAHDLKITGPSDHGDVTALDPRD